MRFYPAIPTGSRSTDAESPPDRRAGRNGAGGGRRGLERSRIRLTEAIARRWDDGAVKFSKVTASGRTTIPKSIREAAGLYAGDVIAFETDGDQVVVRKVPGERDAPAQDLSETMSEWASAEDEEAWRDL